ncbi:MAG: hypothetical protein K2V38_22965 [Gemmataceae bacterium]|nr:hypothetical protein [Gemmataceae bacterium]
MPAAGGRVQLAARKVGRGWVVREGDLARFQVARRGMSPGDPPVAPGHADVVAAVGEAIGLLMSGLPVEAVRRVGPRAYCVARRGWQPGGLWGDHPAGWACANLAMAVAPAAFGEAAAAVLCHAQARRKRAADLPDPGAGSREMAACATRAVEAFAIDVRETAEELFRRPAAAALVVAVIGRLAGASRVSGKWLQKEMEAAGLLVAKNAR